MYRTASTLFDEDTTRFIHCRLIVLSGIRWLEMEISERFSSLCPLRLLHRSCHDERLVCPRKKQCNIIVVVFVFGLEHGSFRSVGDRVHRDF